MDLVTTAFSYVCGQGRPFLIDGAPLPVCERCFGLYAGAALTTAWLLASGLWRRGLPHTREVLVQAAMLLAAMAGGLHWIDPGPAWRLLCGLWTGHVAMVWLVGGARHLARSAARGQRLRLPAAPWPGRSRLQALAAGPALAILAMAFAGFVHTGWHVWAALALLGAASLVAGLAGAAGALAVAAAAPKIERGASRKEGVKWTCL